jgi:Uma2 family endonuclease
MTVVAARPISTPIRPRIDVETYHRIGRDGRIAPDARVELLDGEIVAMAPIGPDHAATVDEFGDTERWRRGVPVRVRVQGPVRLDAWSEPQPDIAILRARPDGYRSSHPGPADILLLIEVADSSLLTDRTRKIPLYARAGIVEVWLVDLVARAIEVHRAPGTAGYASVQAISKGLLRPQLLPEVAIDVAAALGGPG